MLLILRFKERWWIEIVWVIAQFERLLWTSVVPLKLSYPIMLYLYWGLEIDRLLPFEVPCVESHNGCFRQAGKEARADSQNDDFFSLEFDRKIWENRLVAICFKVLRNSESKSKTCFNRSITVRSDLIIQTNRNWDNSFAKSVFSSLWSTFSWPKSTSSEQKSMNSGI